MILPTAEIVCLGNELLIGITINTNASFIGEKLTELGYEVRRVTCIRDEVDLSVEFFKELFKRKPKLVIVSGGLGPTYDDIQLKVISKSTELELQENSEALEQIKKYYSKRDLKLTKERRKMAFIPEGAKVLDNQVGGAPGCHVVYKEMDIYCLPGVPTEMKDIFNRHIFPYLRKQNEYQLFIYLNLDISIPSHFRFCFNRFLKEHLILDGITRSLQVRNYLLYDCSCFLCHHFTFSFKE